MPTLTTWSVIMPNHHNDPTITPVLPYRIEDKRPISDRVINKVVPLVGLGGIRERWTTGELGWWIVSAWMLGIGTGGFISWLVAN